MSLHEFDYTKIYTADTVAKSSECIYSRDTYRTTGDFTVVMNAGSYAEWKIEACQFGRKSNPQICTLSVLRKNEK